MKHTWALPKKEFGSQYTALLARMRRVMAAVLSGKAKGIPGPVLESAARWATPSQCKVRPLWVFPVIDQVLRGIFRNYDLPAHRDLCYLASVVSRFLGSFHGKKLTQSSSFVVRVADLQPVSWL